MSNWAVRAGRAKRQAHRIFEFFIGLVFLFFAGVGIMLSMTAWHTYLDHPSAGLFKFYLFISFTVTLLFLCLYSFLKARSIR